MPLPRLGVPVFVMVVMAVMATSVLVAPGSVVAQGSAVRASSRRAASCFERFAAGTPLPPAPRPASEASGILQALMPGAGTSDPAAAEARARLRYCLPRELSFDTRLSRTQARWLAGCFSDVEDQIDATACLTVGRALATYDPDIAEFMGREDVQGQVPGVSLTPTAHPYRTPVGDVRIVAALAQASGALASCRDAHGFGELRVWAVHDSGSWTTRVWAREGTEALVTCVTQALAQAPPPPDESGSVAFELALVAPTRSRPSRRVGGGLRGGLGGKPDGGLRALSSD